MTNQHVTVDIQQLAEELERAHDLESPPFWSDLPKYVVTGRVHVPAQWADHAGWSQPRVRVQLHRTYGARGNYDTHNKPAVSITVDADQADDPRLQLGAFWRLTPD